MPLVNNQNEVVIEVIYIFIHIPLFFFICYSINTISNFCLSRVSYITCINCLFMYTSVQIRRTILAQPCTIPVLFLAASLCCVDT